METEPRTHSNNSDKEVIPNMTMAKKRAKETGSRTDWERLRQMRDEDIDTSEVAELDDSFWAQAEMGSPLRKRLISLRLDSDVIDWFKSQGPSYQTRMNQVLRAYMKWCQKT